MGVQYINSSFDSISMDNYTCENCGEAALVLCGDTPAGWKEKQIDDICGCTNKWYCPTCAEHAVQS